MCGFRHFYLLRPVFYRSFQLFFFGFKITRHQTICAPIYIEPYQRTFYLLVQRYCSQYTWVQNHESTYEVYKTNNLFIDSVNHLPHVLCEVSFSRSFNRWVKITTSSAAAIWTSWKLLENHF